MSDVAIFYTLVGLAFTGLTLRPVFEHRAWFNIPFSYILVGALGAGIGLPVVSPIQGETENKIIEHASELIVIISLAGVGLAIDQRASWSNWQATWRLLAISMPVTILGVALLGIWLLSLPIAAAILLGAVLAPTDPVLARSVQVGTPGSPQAGTSVALTAEAGLNDGLAFPFVWLAVGLAGAANLWDFSWWSWVSYDLVYRTGTGIVVGILVGWLMTRLIFSRIGDAQQGRENPVLVVLSATFLAYGLAEAIHGYGFLSVFIAARASRVFPDQKDGEPYEVAAHKSADQLEGILLAILLLWLGIFVGSELWMHWNWSYLFLALSLIFIIRPISAFVSMYGQDCSLTDRFKIAFFGVRGMGTIFYVAFAFSHADFAKSVQQEIWAVCALTIIVSAIVHGTLASRWMTDENAKA
jgi:NhaP-type Na+/H+ or K+/H+ antiporter